MPASPASVTVRTYDVGFGDCLLVTFQYATGVRHLLIDFGSMSLPAGKTGTGSYMKRIANQIKIDCGGKLTAVVATHRHKDHISGFGGSGAESTGGIIKSLQPEIVLQPWTEDPDAATDAKKIAGPRQGQRFRRNAMLLNLQHMNRVAGFIAESAGRLRGAHLREVREQLQFIGDDNTLKNRDAIVNLMTMGKRKPRYLSAGDDAGLGTLLPGVQVHVLGPPTLEQAPDLKNETDTNPDEFWAVRKAFWARQGGAPGTASKPLFKNVVAPVPWDARWYRDHAQTELGEAMLSLVRILDDAMNNTSLVLLFEIGSTCLLFPGDAQWENWQFALSQPKYLKLLKRVRLYKVGHHGSRNATPKTLWNHFDHKGGAVKPERLQSMMSTKDGVYGDSVETKVPRDTLVTALKSDSTLTDTRDSKPGELSRLQTIKLNG